MKKFAASAMLVCSMALVSSSLGQDKPVADDLTPGFKAPARDSGFGKRVVMIPMRDGVKLYTVIVIPSSDNL